MIKKNIYIITALTNMHVGSGDSTYGLIDKQVQRDVLTNYPTIHASSLKGALREYFTEEMTEDAITYIFGTAQSETDSRGGKYKFFAANLLSLPMRSNHKPFYRVTTKEIIENFLEYIIRFAVKIPQPLTDALGKLKNVEMGDKAIIFVRKSEITAMPTNGKKIKVEDVLGEENYKLLDAAELTILENLFGENLCIMQDADFNAVAAELPVIARNCLENGISQNLWYEEIVPRESRFYFGVITGHDEKSEGILAEEINRANMIQIGANASIGYGYTKIDDLTALIGEKHE